MHKVHDSKSQPMSLLDCVLLLKLPINEETLLKTQDDLKVLITLGYIEPVIVGGEMLYKPSSKLESNT